MKVTSYTVWSTLTPLEPLNPEGQPMPGHPRPETPKSPEAFQLKWTIKPPKP